MLDEDGDLPSFERPPVVETILGVEFRPLEGWSVVHYGLYWDSVRSAYPKVEFRPPIASGPERFGKEAWTQQMVFEQIDFGGGSPPVRCLYIAEDGGRLVQLQKDRFMHNWRKTVKPYPRYPESRARFIESWDEFLRFLKAQQISMPEVVQCEVTYINHIERGQGWSKTSDLSRVVPLINDVSHSFLPEPEIIVLDERFLIPDERGRLRVVIQPAIRNTDGQEVLQVTLTARGRPRASATEAILEWLDLGRRWVVKGFADVTSADAHKVWGKTA
jgi:uncharacterized protein (TIGR04255 family)